MKHNSRYIAVFLTIAMVLTPLFSVVATPATTGISNNASEKASVLNSLSLYAGVSERSFDPDLSASLDRETGVVMLLRILGLEAKAQAMSDESATAALAGYADASTVSSWAKKQMAYAVSNKLLVGTSSSTLSPKASLNGKAYCSLILRQLGYSVSYDQAVTEFAGLTELKLGEAVMPLSSKTLLKEDLVGISFASLSLKAKDSDKTVLDSLIAQKAIPADAAKLINAKLPDGSVIPTPVSTEEGGEVISSNSSHSHHPATFIITGLPKTISVEDGTQNSIPFTLAKEADAVFATLSPSEVVGGVEVTGSGISYQLKFNATSSGSAVIYVSAIKNFQFSDSQSITVTVTPTLGAIEASWPGDFSSTPAAFNATPSAFTLGSTVPHDVSFAFDLSASNQVFGTPVMIDHLIYYSLSVVPLKAGTGVLTINISKAGYHTISRSITLTFGEPVPIYYVYIPIC